MHRFKNYYYDLNGITYDKYIAYNNGFNQYVFRKSEDYSDKELKDNLKQLIDVYEGNLNKIGDKDYSLSRNWYDKKPHMHKKLQNNISNFFKHKVKTKSDENMWSTFKDFKSKLKGKGYTKGFVSCNTRATNDYQHKTALVYAMNRYLNPTIIDYFRSHDVNVDEDLFALSELIQWIWRSAIRNNEPINLYLPSKTNEGFVEYVVG